jgi:hypothetical protein
VDNFKPRKEKVMPKRETFKFDGYRATTENPEVIRLILHLEGIIENQSDEIITLKAAIFTMNALAERI